MKRIITVFVFILLTVGVNAQSTIFTDAFATSRGTAYSATSAAAIGSSPTWSLNRVVDWGAKIDLGVLGLTNDASATANVAGYSFANLPVSTGFSGYNSQLNLNSSKISWSFNVQTNRTTVLSSTYASTSYYGGLILGSTSQTLSTAGNGYAVLLRRGSAGTLNGISLVAFTTGLNTTIAVGGQIIYSVAAGDLAGINNWASVKVTYDPSTNAWSLFVRDDGATASVDPSTVATQVGTATTNTTYTGTALPYFGAYWQGSTQATNNMTFDNIKVEIATTSAPTSQPAFAAFSNIGTAALTTNWTAGNGTGRVVYMNSSNTFTDPTNGVSPTAATAWAGAGQQCIYNGSGTTVNLTGLSAGTTYYFRAYEFNGSGATIKYFLTTPPSTSQASTIVPVTQSSAIGFPTVGTNSFTINWTNGSGAGRIVRVNSANSFINPSNGTAYSGTAAYTSGEQTVYSGTGSSVAVTGLSQGITYYVEIFEYNGTGTGITYNTTSPATGNQSTAASAPTTQPTFSAFTNIGTTGLTVNWSAGNGAGRVVYISDGSSFTDPTNGVSPTASTAYSGTGQQCVLNGTGTTVGITGLTAGTTYYFHAYEFNGTGATTTYFLTTPGSTNQATAIVPVTQSSAVTFTPVATTTMTINWTSGTGANRIVRVNTANTFVPPVDGTAYTGTAAYTSGERTVYNGPLSTVAITGLVQGTTYYVEIFESNGTGTGIVYNTISPAIGSQTTTVNPPSTQPTFTAFTNIGTASLTANWTVGNGAGRVIYLCDANSFVDPSTGVSPTANTVYSGTGQQCIYIGTGTNNVVVTGLPAGTTYYLQAYEYNGSGATITYLTTSPRNTSTATVIVPVTQSSALNFTPVANTTMTINWTSGSGANRIVRVNTANTFVPPVDGTAYTGTAAYTSGERTVYSGALSTVAITGLVQGTTYYVEIFEFSGTGTGIVYNTTSPAAASQATTVTTPTAPVFTAFTNVGMVSITANWTVGTGAGRVVYVSDANTFVDPVTGESPTANTVYSGTGQQCLYNGTGANSVIVTALTAGTAYYFKAYDYNGSDVSKTYSAASTGTTTSSTVTVPTTQSSAVNFTPVSATGMTINWTNGNGANRIVRVNTANTFVLPADGTTYSGTAAYTSGERTVYNGTGSSVAITGLSPITTYYVEIFEYSGTGTGIVYDTVSPALANQVTLDASATTDYFRSIGTGTWATIGTWESSHDSTTWTSATLAPTSAAKSISVNTGHTVTVGATATASNLIVQSGGILTLTSGLTVSHNASHLYPFDLQLSGTLTATGVLTLSTASGEVLSGGLYQHNQNGGTIPTMTWAQGTSNAPTSDGSNIIFTGGSTCEITGITSATSMVGLAQTFWNFTVNSNQTAVNFSCAAQLSSVNGTLWIKSLGILGSQFRLVDRLTSATMTFGAIRCSNVSATPVFFFINGGTAAPGFTDILNVGDIIMDGTASVFTVNNQTQPGTYNINISGNVSIGTGTILQFQGSLTTVTTSVNFNKSGLQKYTKSGTLSASTVLAYTVLSGSILDLGPSTIPSTTLATFTLNSGATLKTGHAQGISTTVTTGAIQVPGTRSFNAGANYEYNGSSVQVTGNALPATVNDLIINNSAGVTLTSNTAVSGTLNLTLGTLGLNSNTLTLGSSTAVKGSLSYTAGNLTGAGTFTRWFDASAVTLGTAAGRFPLGTSTADASLFIGGTPTVGGTVSVSYSNASGTTDFYAEGTPPTDTRFDDPLGFTVNHRHNMNWTSSTANSFAASDLSLQINGDAIGVAWIQDVNSLRIIHASDATGIGTAGVNGGNATSPTINRTGLTESSLGGTFYIGSGGDNALPVELTSFTANVSGKNVILKWTTATEINNSYFSIERTKQSVLKSWQEIVQVRGAGNSNSPKNYSFTDMVSESGDYTYRLIQHDNDGTKQIMMETSAKVSIPLNYTLEQNYPNPFNPSTEIHYSIPEDNRVNIAVFAVTGQLIKTLVDEYQSAGFHSIRLDASKLSSGTYIYQMNAGKNKLTKKLVILK